MKRRTYLAGTLACFSRLALPAGTVALAGCGAGSEPEQLIDLTGPTMGTGYRVKVRGEAGGAPALQGEIAAILDRVDHLMSTYRADSELYAFNAAGAGEWRPVAEDTRAVLTTAGEVNAVTGGAFDVTVGPLVDLWGFGPAGAVSTPPRDAAISDASAAVGVKRLEAGTGTGTLRKTVPGLRVDLSGIAKGYAVDLAAAHLDARGVEHYLVEIGGELRGKGRRPDGTPWRVGIERPVPARRTVYRVLHLDAQAVATSGDYRIYFEHAGQRFSHTIDPRTARPITHALASVSVVADSAMRADALSTALMVLGPDEGFEFARQQDIAALFISRAGDGFTERWTPALTPHLEG